MKVILELVDATRDSIAFSERLEAGVVIDLDQVRLDGVEFSGCTMSAKT